jgi:hypothetical protein
MAVAQDTDRKVGRKIELDMSDLAKFSDAITHYLGF